jgi:hypothetical protein
MHLFYRSQPGESALKPKKNYSAVTNYTFSIIFCHRHLFCGTEFYKITASILYKTLCSTLLRRHRSLNPHLLRGNEALSMLRMIFSARAFLGCIISHKRRACRASFHCTKKDSISGIFYAAC